MRLSQNEALEIVVFTCLKHSEEEEEEKKSVDAESHKLLLCSTSITKVKHHLLTRFFWLASRRTLGQHIVRKPA